MELHRPQTTQSTAYDLLHVRADAHPVVIAAAYRALARLCHPDADPRPGAAERMAELNGAYARLRTPEARAAYDRAIEPPVRATASAAEDQLRSMRNTDTDGLSTPLGFGRYRGWTIEELVRHDPDYLRWLRRHSSGIRHRREIDERLNAAASATATLKRSWSLRARRPVAAA